MSIKIVIADDHSIIREGIKSVLASHPEYEVIAEAGNGNEALEYVRNLKPDVLLLDISMPELSGLDIIARAKSASPNTHIIVISVHKLGAYVLKALRHGASAYLNKDNVAEELIPALSKTSSGKAYLGEAISQYLADTFKESSGKPQAAENFTERELDILRLVVEGKTAKQIAEVLFVSRRTVENYKNGILKKLNLHKTSDLIKYALENKLVE